MNEFRDAASTVAAIARREASSREVLEQYLDQIERHAWVNAVVTVDVDGARRQADVADAAVRSGAPLGRLHGLPMTIKHDLEVAGMLSTYGSTFNSSHVPTRDAPSVATLRAAGAIVFGRTNLPEFASDGQSYNDLHGTTVNPWDPSRTAGGSSGGSAAAVAAGMTGMDLGSDMGGSIRIPAAWCGVFGLKPTWDVVPMTGFAPTPGDADFPRDLLPEDVAASGPLARSASDLRLAFDVLTGTAAGSNPLQRAPRLAAWLDDDRLPTSAATAAVLETASARLRNAGITVSQRPPSTPLLDDLEELFEIMFMADMVGHLNDDSYAGMVEAMPSRSDWMSRTHGRAATLTHRDWLQREATRNRVVRQWDDVFQEVDAMLTPVVFTSALRHDHSLPVDDRRYVVDGHERSWRPELTRWCGAAGVAGLPAVTVPVGLDADGLPVGIQVISALGQDHRAIAVAEVIERVCGGYVVPPLCL